MRWPVCMVLLTCIVANAQEYPRKEVDLERLADELFGYQDLDLNYEELYENLALLLSNPININTANTEQLRFLNLLTEAQVQSLVNYRTENGPLISMYELQAVPGFEVPDILRITPFFIVSNPATGFDRSFLKRITQSDNSYFIMRYDRTLETKAGFTNSVSESQQFKGKEDKLYLRFRSARPGDYSFGFTMEKDAGEQMAWSSSKKQYGFDYNSFHAQVLNKGRVKNLIVGDYQAQFAQGLLLGGNFGFGKGGETVTTVRRSNLGFMPYTSVNELGYLRGAAVTYELHKNIFVSSFYSNAFRDASIADDSTEQSFAAAFQTTGLHRNEAELSSRKRIREQQYGVIINYRIRQTEAGFIFNHIDYNLIISRTPRAYNQFAFSGNGLDNIGIFLNHTVKNFTFFSEAGKTLNRGYGVVAGLLGSITQQFDLVLHFRNYQRNFYSLYANAFAEGSLPINEGGIYWGWKYRWNKKYNVAGYADLFHFPWLRYRSYTPSDGHEWLLRFTYQPVRSVLLFVQVREESKVRNLSTSESNLYLTGEGIKRNLWLNADYGLGTKLRLKTRAQFSSYIINNRKTYGMALLQDVAINFGRLSVTARYALFDTDDYDNRQYVYERDVWLAYSLPAYSGIGIRSYILAEYGLSRRLSIWLRWARTTYTHQEVIGSGADAITGNKRNDLRMQVRFRF
ncbi:MAG: helix-hairpin-helix domain-containing protein [Flammeovirgaceae bacterium]|nr:MAG: helix-hairpin-helix domain-containing protein [Flammeovirgaceae bacterium]